MAKRRKIWAWVYGLFIALYVLLLAAAALYILGKVWTYAEEYEASQPEKVIDPYVEQLRENLWDEGIEQTLEQMPHEAQSDEEVAEIVKNMLRNEITCSRQAAVGNVSDSNRITYNLRCGDRVFGQVTIAQDQSKADDLEFGLLPWRIESEQFDFTGLYSSVRVTVPEIYTVKLNGWELGSEYIVEEGIHYDVLDEYYDSYPDLPTKVTYEFDNVIGSLEPEIYDEDGNPTVIDPEKDDSQFIHPVEGAMFDRLSEFAGNFVSRYREYVSGVYDTGFGYQRLAPYMRLGSDLDQRMIAAQDGLYWSHTTSIRVDWVELNSAIALGDGYYLLDVSSQATATHPGRGVETNRQSMKVIACDTADEIRAVTMSIYENEDQETE